MRKKISVLILMLVSGWGSVIAQSDASFFRKGNDQYKDGKYNEAEIQYRKGLEQNKDSWTGQYNLADALYKQEKFKEASVLLDSLATRTKNPKQLSSVYHNLGNALMKEKSYEQSVDAYKKALKLNPDAEDSRYNLSYAYKMLKKQQEQEQKQEQQQKKQEEKKDDQKQKQDQKKEEEKKQNINQQEAERMLDALDQQEKQLRKQQQKKEKRPGVGGGGKDW
jgi:Ca-activated chloride channel homolog